MLIKYLLLSLLSTPLIAQPDGVPASCSNATLTGNYGYLLNGTAGGLPITTVGQIATNGNGTISGSLTTSSNGSISNLVELLGSYQISPNCTGTMTITPAGLSSSNFSVSVTSGGKQIQMVEIDSGTVESGTAYAQGIATCSTVGTKGGYGMLGGGSIIGSGPQTYGGEINLRGDGTITGTETGSANGTIFQNAAVSGAFKIDRICQGGAVITVGQGSLIHLNLVVVNAQKTVLFIQTDASSLSSGILQQ